MSRAGRASCQRAHHHPNHSRGNHAVDAYRQQGGGLWGDLAKHPGEESEEQEVEQQQPLEAHWKG